MRLVLLGYGAVGKITARDLQNNSIFDEILIVDNFYKGNDKDLKTEGLSKASIKSLDVNDKRELNNVVAGSNVVINALPFELNLTAMEAALNAKVPYVDLGGLYYMTKKQLTLDKEFEKAELPAIIGMGGAPGITNIFTKYACDRLDTVENIHIYDGGKEENPPANTILRWGYSLDTILDEVSQDAIVYKNGEYLNVPFSESDVEEYLFPQPIGALRVHNCLHSELATIPEVFKHKGLKEVTYKINFSNLPEQEGRKIKFLADLGFASKKPISVKGQNIVPRDILIYLASKLPQEESVAGAYESLCVVARGLTDGVETEFELQALAYSRDGSILTSVPASIIAQWIAEGKINKRGVLPPETIIEPEEFFKDLKKRNVNIIINKKEKF